MSNKIKRNRVIVTLLSAIFLVTGTLLAIQIAKGYRPNLQKHSLNGTGLLSSTSYPKGAQVYIDDRLTTVTDDTLYLLPNTYNLKIIKNGFLPWTKTVVVKPELVTLTDARLFPSIPSITPVTFYQALNPLVSPDGTKVAYILTNSPFKEDNGLYILSLNNNLINGQSNNQIADLTTFDYTKATLSWTPDSSQLLAIFDDGKKITASHLLQTKGNNTAKSIIDVTAKLPQILDQWQSQLITQNKNNLSVLPDFMAKAATSSATNVYFSPDKEKIFYTAADSFTLPENIIGKNLNNINSTPENRKLSKDDSYVYDIKEGTNYRIDLPQNQKQQVSLLTDQAPAFALPTPTTKTTTTRSKTKVVTPEVTELSLILNQIYKLRGQYDPRLTTYLSWYSTSRHLLISTVDGVSIIDYDNLNKTNITNAKLKSEFAVTSPDGSHLLILSNINQNPDTFNILTLDLK